MMWIAQRGQSAVHYVFLPLGDVRVRHVERRGDRGVRVPIREREDHARSGPWLFAGTSDDTAFEQVARVGKSESTRIVSQDRPCADGDAAAVETLARILTEVPSVVSIQTGRYQAGNGYSC